MIEKLLIANRGEIACRIIRTCEKLGVKTVALYSEPDKHARHVLMANESYALGGSTAKESYLNIDKIIAIARESKADAIHPGYGFLSENATFAKAVEDAGLIFVGPQSQVIQSMANKDHAKSLMNKAGVPIIPGFYGSDQSLETLSKEAQSIQLPLIIKASAGGGGKGMRIVESLKDLIPAIESAKREALSSFGDDTLILEKYLKDARHIEVQVFRDTHKNTVHLFDRDCSLQRRHQKVIEEAPALHIQPKIRDKMLKAAVVAAETIDYTNAGTVEFLYTSDHQFYFLEMNTRLQVEHPVTEMITGIDLVEWQLMVANKQPLPLTQIEIHAEGHAIEARIYAEDPMNQFLPSTGTIEALMLPKQDSIRYELGVSEHDKIGIYYDPLLAKVIAFGKDRSDAISKLKQALQGMEIVGVVNNISFLRVMLDVKDFQKGIIHTHYLNQHLDTLLDGMKKKPCHGLAPVVLAYLLKHQQQANELAISHPDPYSPWHTLNAWQLNAPALQDIELIHEHHAIKVSVQHLRDGYFMTSLALKSPVMLSGRLEGPQLHYEVNHQHHVAQVMFYGHNIHFFQEGISELYLEKTDTFDATIEADPDGFTAPMPGVITNIWVKPGMIVNKGDKLIAMEAMKMEHTLSATQHGIIKSVYYKVGDQVDQGSPLFEFENHDS